MKYFTPALLNRFQSPDDDVFAASHDEWDRAIVRYNRRWEKIKRAFPEGVRRLDKERVGLHDARLVSMGQQGELFLFVLHPEPPAQSVVALTFTLDGPVTIDQAALPGWQATEYVVWLYEEFDLDRQKRCLFEVLFSNGWSVKLRFRDFHYLIAQRLFPVPEAAAGTLASPAPHPVSQPA
jgi:hypothetical protein